MAGHAVPGRRREVRPEDGDVPDVEPAAGTERRSRADQPGQPRSSQGGRQGLAAGRRHLHRAAPRSGVRQVRSVRAVQDPAAQHLRRHLRTRRTTSTSPCSAAEDIGRIDAKTGAINVWKTPTKRLGTAPRHDRRAGSPVVRRESRPIGSGCSTRGPRRFQEWLAPTPESWPYDVTADTNGDVWAGGEYSDRVLRLDPKTGADHRVSAAAVHQHPARVRGQLHDAGDLLGRQQSRRLDREARAA